MTVTAAVVPAAGAARRFGGGKLTTRLEDGRPLLEHTLESLLEAGLHHVVVVAADADAFAEVAAIRDPRVTLVVNPEPDRGMFASIRCGLDSLATAPDVLVVLPGDMPFVRAAVIASLVAEASRGRAVVPRFAGRRGHPLVLPGRFVDPLRHQPDTTTLKLAMGTLGVTPEEIDVDDPGVLRDVDRPEDLSAS